MRLPQSHARSLSARVTCSVFLLVAFACLPLHARSSQQLRCSPTNLKFGSVVVSQSATQTVTVTNNGQTSVTITSLNVSGTGFSQSGLALPATVAAGKSVTVNVTFTPGSTGWVGGQLTVTTSPFNSNLSVGLHGFAVGSNPMTAAPSTVSFGSVQVGSNSSQSLVLTNSGTTAETVTAFQTTGSGFSVSGPQLPLFLSRGQSITLTVTFAPPSSGSLSGNIFVPGPGLSIPLTGSGGSTTSGQLTITPSSLNLGSVDIGSTTTGVSTITATGGSITVSSASSSSSQFSLSGASFPMTLASGQTAQLNVVYAPTTSGAASATLTFTTGSSSKSTESLTGTGVSPQVSVSLSWNASTSSVSGYNVYRGTTSGVYSKINTALDPSTTYTDTTISSGKTYYYAATSVDSNGQESTYSAPTQVAIP
jgi:Abnormal spindle-like microcephaly-assoc'd, ASPM-SPD-2-Hydin